MQALQQIFNFVPLTARVGTAGQPLAGQFKAIAAAGYEAVLNLAMPDHAESIDDEAAIVTSLGMIYLHIPVPFDAPRMAHLRQFIRLMQALGNQRVFVHCIMNYRVSVFMYQYLRVCEGYDDASARSPIFETWQPDARWQELMAVDARALVLD